MIIYTNKHILYSHSTTIVLRNERQNKYTNIIIVIEVE